MNARKLLSSFFGVAGIKAGSIAGSFFVGAIFAQQLGPEDFGVYSFVVSLTLILSILPSSGISTFLVREVAYAKKCSGKSEVIYVARLALCVSVVAMVAVAIVYLVSFDLRKPFQSAGVNSAIILSMAFLIALLKNFSAIARGMGSLLFSVFFQEFTRWIFAIILCCVLIYVVDERIDLQSALMVFLAGLSLSVLLAGANMTVRVRQADKMSTSLNNTVRRRGWARSIALLSTIGGVQILNSNLDVMLLYMLGTSENVGIYRAAVTISGLMGVSLNVLNTIAAPQFVSYVQERDNASLEKLAQRCAMISSAASFTAMLIFIAFGRQIVVTVYGDEFFASWCPLLILGLGQLVNSIFGPVANLANMYDMEDFTAISLIFSLGLCVLLHLLLIPSLGTLGAAIATSMSLVSWNVMVWAFLLKKKRINTLFFASGILR